MTIEKFLKKSFYKKGMERVPWCYKIIGGMQCVEETLKISRKEVNKLIQEQVNIHLFIYYRPCSLGTRHNQKRKKRRYCNESKK